MVLDDAYGSGSLSRSIHLYNIPSIFKAILPYHGTHIFSRVVRTITIEYALPSRLVSLISPRSQLSLSLAYSNSISALYVSSETSMWAVFRAARQGDDGVDRTAILRECGSSPFLAFVCEMVL